MASPKVSDVPFVIAFGEGDYFLDQVIESARARKGRHVVFLDGEGLSDAELVGVCETRSMDDTPQIVIVDEANKIKGDKALKQYIEDKSPKDTSTILVAICRSKKCPAIWAQASKKGRIEECRKLKTYDDNNEVIRWVEKRAERMGLTLDKGLAVAFFQLLGDDLHRIAGEMRKLALLVGKETATAQHLRLIVAPALMATPFQVVDAAVNKDPRSALNYLSTVYRNMGDDADLILVGTLMQRIERLAVVRSLLDRGMAPDDIAVAIGMVPFLFSKSVLPQARRHSLQDLIGIMGRLCRLDVDVKGSARSKRTHVELAVLSIAG